MEKLDEIAKEEFSYGSVHDFLSQKIIKTGINVKKVIEQLKKYPGDWDHQKNLKGLKLLLDRGFA